jgi:hypothetical protein
MTRKASDAAAASRGAPRINIATRVVMTACGVSVANAATGRWFYERARGGYGAQEARAAARASQKRAFAKETPKDRRFAKIDLAKFLNVWEGHPDQVAYGSQKNFQLFMQREREAKTDPENLDEVWYRRLIAIAIVFRTVVKIVRGEKFPAYQANITAYTIACLSWQTGGRIDFEAIWAAQAISMDLQALLRTWSHEVDRLLRETAGAKMPTEAAKRPETWVAIKNRAPALPDPLPPELSAQNTSMRLGSGSISIGASGLTAVDLAMISETRGIDAKTWLEVAAWGQKTKKINHTFVGIARSMAELAVGGWERSPSAKQAKWALEAHKAFASRD